MVAMSTLPWETHQYTVSIYIDAAMSFYCNTNSSCCHAHEYTHSEQKYHGPSHMKIVIQVFIHS